MTKKNAANLPFLLLVVLVMALSIWGPEALANYKDRSILGKPHMETAEKEGEGYRYILSANEKIFILSRCLNSQTLPESEQNAMTRTESDDSAYGELQGSYAFVANRREEKGTETSDEDAFTVCNREIQELKKLGILPESVRVVEESAYDALLYSAIDVLEPRNNVAVWKFTLSGSKKNAGKENRLLDIYMDADTGKIYEFYARTELMWEEIQPDSMMDRWSAYLGLKAPVPYETPSPLLETTPYFQKYLFAGVGEEKTVATIGFYEGINELFLKISK